MDNVTNYTVWSFYRRAKEKGIWEQINDELVKLTRIKAGRKRQTVVDFMGNILAIVVHAANIHDTKGILPTTLAKEK